MSTTDQPGPEHEITDQEKTTALLMPFQGIAPAYRTSPVAAAAKESLRILGDRVHALESAPHAEVSVVEFEGCRCHGVPLPEADGAEHTAPARTVESRIAQVIAGARLTHEQADTIHEAVRSRTTEPRPSTPEENARADARTEQLGGSDFVTLMVGSLLANRTLDDEQAARLHELVETAAGKQDSHVEIGGERMTEAQFNAAQVPVRAQLAGAERERDEATAAAEGWRAAAEATQRDADEHHLFGIRGPEDGVDLLDWAREYARSVYGTSKLIYSPGAVVSLQHAGLALQTLADDAETQRGKQAALARESDEKNTAYFRSGWEAALREVRDRLPHGTLAAFLTEQGLLVREFGVVKDWPDTEPIPTPRTDPDVVAARYGAVRGTPLHIDREEPAPPTEGPKHLKLSGMNGTGWAAPGAPRPSAEPVAAAINHDPILDEPDRGLGLEPDRLQAAVDAAIADTTGGVATLLRYFGIDPARLDEIPPTKPERAPFAFTERPDDGLDPREETPSERMNRVMGEAIGAASTCWPNMAGTGIFDEARAREILAALQHEVELFLLHDRQAQRDQQ